MIRGTLHELHALFGILAAAIVIPTGCMSDQFEGCEASRTCPPSKGGEAGVGGDGESGDTNTGGDSGETSTGGSSGTGTGGSAGSNGDTGGEGGSGGADDDTSPPTIVSFTPADGDVDVERDITVTVTFSEPIDERTVTETSVALSGPDGEISGALSVEENVISFVPERKLNLLGTYVLGIDEMIADLAGNTLGERASAEFRVRDGRWSEPEYPFGNTISRTVMDFDSNARGDMIVVIGSQFAQDVEAATYDAGTGRWSPPSQLPGTAGGYLLSPLAIDASGRGVLCWTHDVAHHLWHSTDDGDWVNAAPLGGYASTSVTSSGLAMAAWQGSSGVDTLLFDLDDGSQVSSSFELPGVTGTPRPIASQDRVAILAITHSSANGDELWIAWRDGSTWNEPELLASAPVLYGPSVDSDEQGNMVVIWRENDRVWSRIYERNKGAWTSELLVAGTATPAFASSVAMTAGSVLVSLNSSTTAPSTWAAVYRPDVGWSDPSFVLLDSRGGGSRVALDSAGNGIATWTLGGDLEFRRYVAGAGWQEPSSLTARLMQSYVWAATAPDGSVTVVANEAVGAQYAPWVVRFE